jgi:hypothetical protein
MHHAHLSPFFYNNHNDSPQQISTSFFFIIITHFTFSGSVGTLRLQGEAEQEARNPSLILVTRKFIETSYLRYMT